MSYPDYRPIAAKCKPNTLWRLGSRTEQKRKSRPARSWNLGAGLGYTVEGETPCAYI